MTVDVVWLSENPDAISRGYWDQGVVEAALSGALWREPAYHFRHRSAIDQATNGGAIVVVPARWHVGHEAALSEQLARLDWALVILTGDEEGVFAAESLQHPNLRLWVQTPVTGRYGPAVRLLGDFWPPSAPALIAECDEEAFVRPNGWFFAGQLNNERRAECVEALRRRHDGQIKVTKIFGSGYEYVDYLHGLAAARVAPCPSGTYTPDTFRLYEALEAGCVPVVDRHAPKGDGGDYWPYLFGEDPPFPIVDSWDEFDGVFEATMVDWKGAANRAFAWWQGYKRRVAWWLTDDLAALTGTGPASRGPDDDITVLIPTSPIPSHPSLAVIEETVASVRERLPTAEIIVMIDGVRPEQEDRRADYDEYVRRLLWATNHEWSGVVPMLADGHLHQAVLTASALTAVRTPTILFVEHDTPLVGDVDWQGVIRAVRGGSANLVRLHHEANVLPPHRHLMLDSTPRDVDGVPLLRTIQWSQRPHVASTEFYRWMTGRYFGPDARTMIEDVMHGVVVNEFRENGLAGWGRFKTWLYAPDGDMKRSTHLDGRGDDPKFPMTWAYDGDTPFGAPNPRRTDEP